MKKKEIAVTILLVLMFFYTTLGNRDSILWSGMYFLALHTSLLLFILDLKNKVLKIGGAALQISIILYVICIYFLRLQYERHYTIVPFLISILILLNIEKKSLKQNAGIFNK